VKTDLGGDEPGKGCHETGNYRLAPACGQGTRQPLSQCWPIEMREPAASSGKI
jgi:hypothetical protein